MNRAFVCAVLLSAGCPTGGTTPKPASELTVPQIALGLDKARAELTSFRGDSTMDYWLSGQRAKGEVLVMGKVGKFVRFAALSPAGGSTIAEMACDGTNFAYVDYQNNCSRTGPCDARSVGAFFGIELEPDDFIHLALGTPPLVGNPTGTATWDSKRGAWNVALSGEGGTQKLSIDNRENRWDVLDTELATADGKSRWSVSNTDFAKRTGSGERRIPGKTRFKSPVQNQDLLVEWSELEVNAQLPNSKFQIAVPQGLPTCGQNAPIPGQAPPAAGQAPPSK